MKKLQDIMSKDVVFSNPDASLEEIARIMVDCDCGEVPLVNNTQERKVVGVITDRDIVCRTLGQGQNPMECSAKDCMSSPAVTCKVDSSIDECVSLMEENQIRRIPVVDDQGCLCGIIAQADLAQVDENKAREVLQEVSRPSESASQITH